MIDRSLFYCVIRTIEHSTCASIVLFALSIQAISLIIDDNIDLNANDLHHISIDLELNLSDIPPKIVEKKIKMYRLNKSYNKRSYLDLYHIY